VADPGDQADGKRFRVNLISAISNAGMLRFRLFTRVVHRSSLHRLPTPAAKGSRRAAGGGRRAAGAAARGWASGAPGQGGQRLGGRHAERIQLQVLPCYSPALTPVELLHHASKANAAGPAAAPIGGRAPR
jgi:hypothetical protein